MRKIFLIAAVVGLIVYLKKRYGQDNDLQAEFRAHRELQKVGNIATSANQASSDAYPLATIGNTPLAGIYIDPFNPDNPAARQRVIETFPSGIFLN